MKIFPSAFRCHCRQEHVATGMPEEMKTKRSQQVQENALFAARLRRGGGEGACAGNISAHILGFRRNDNCNKMLTSRERAVGIITFLGMSNRKAVEVKSFS